MPYVINLTSTYCICPSYRHDIIRYYRTVSGPERIYMLIDVRDHEGNGYLHIETEDVLYDILDGYQRLYGSESCTCRECGGNGIL